MIERRPSISALMFVIALASVYESHAEALRYKPVSSNDIILGFVPEGQWIETTGHAWQSPDGVFLNFSRPSALVALRIDVVQISPDVLARLKAECSAPRQFDGGCNVIIRGQVTTVGGQKGIVAQEIQIRSR